MSVASQFTEAWNFQVVVARLRGEISVLRQGLWDVYGILGFDRDGDATPRSIRSDLVKLVVEAATEFREDSDRLLNGTELNEAWTSSSEAKGIITRQQRLIDNLEKTVDRLRLDLDEVRAERDVLAGEVLP